MRNASRRAPRWWARKCNEFGDTLRRQAALDHARAKVAAMDTDFADARTEQDTGPEPTANPQES